MTKAMLALTHLARRGLGALMILLFPTWYGTAARYRPENHYMRGRGPKWHAKYAGTVLSTRTAPPPHDSH